MDIKLTQGDGVPIYQQIINQIKYLIAAGRLSPDDELPPVRVLAQRLLINPNTVVRAYRELETQGLIYKRRGAGTFVAKAVSPLARREQKRILRERADALLVEARHLKFTLDDVLDVVRERDQVLREERGEIGNDG